MISTAKTQLRPLGAPAAGAYAGVPEADLKGWLGDDYAAIKPHVDEFKAAIEDSFYLQATVGIMPSALPALFPSRGSYLMAGDPTTDAANRVHATVKALLVSPQFAQHPWLVALKRDHAIDYQALTGVLYLIDSYIVGHAINQTSMLDGSSEKNAVPFMSKLDNLGIVMTAAVPRTCRATPFRTT